MDRLYQQYFGLTQAPFSITPDPCFLYLSESHREALAQLSYGIKGRKGFVVLTGEVGTGKTTLIHSLLRDLGDQTHTALIFSTIVNPLDLLRYVCEEFHLIEPRQPREVMHDYLILLNEFLLEKYRNGENCALIIDEAQNLSSDVLESIRLLSNFETSKDKLLQIVLVGQPELSVRLNSQELRQLKQRITLRHELRSLNLSECQEYIAKRLKIAGGDPAILTPSAVDAIHRYSGGIPRLINVLGDNALLTSFALEKEHVDDIVIGEVARDLSLSIPRAPAVEMRRPAIARLNVGVSARSTDMGQLKPKASISVISKYIDASSTAPLPLADKIVPSAYFDALRFELLEAMGPMASIVIEDGIQKLGHNMKAFPARTWDTLIDWVSEEIFDPSMRLRFQQALAIRILEVQRKK
jgi:Type II secretory pathway, component ExeA (predicted ATPase)